MAELSLGIVKDTVQTQTDGEQFEKLHILVVDDDVVTCENLQSILDNMGICAKWVTSGRHAIKLIKTAQSKGEYYDIAIIDWKMPDMDGIETVRRIREIVGPDTMVIIMSSYDWTVIEQEARLAGVDFFCDQALFPEVVRTTLRLAIKKEEEVKYSQRPEPEFHGERLLLVEDNDINLEIAQELLEMRGFVVEAAKNSKQAVELFCASEQGYYKAILMDIRMPVMDGLEATQRIRSLGSEYAAQVPIIAMTANAFQEEVEHAKRIGMNDYLTKPVDVRLLLDVLDHYLNSTKQTTINDENRR